MWFHTSMRLHMSFHILFIQEASITNATKKVGLCTSIRFAFILISEFDDCICTLFVIRNFVFLHFNLNKVRNGK